MGQSWERNRAGHSQPPESPRLLICRMGPARPCFPPLPRLPLKQLAVSHPSTPFCSRMHPTLGFLRKPQTNHIGPRELAQLSYE